MTPSPLFKANLLRELNMLLYEHVPVIIGYCSVNADWVNNQQ